MGRRGMQYWLIAPRHGDCVPGAMCVAWAEMTPACVLGRWHMGEGAHTRCVLGHAAAWHHALAAVASTGPQGDTGGGWPCARRSCGADPCASPCHLPRPSPCYPCGAATVYLICGRYDASPSRATLPELDLHMNQGGKQAGRSGPALIMLHAVCSANLARLCPSTAARCPTPRCSTTDVPAQVWAHLEQACWLQHASNRERAPCKGV